MSGFSAPSLAAPLTTFPAAAIPADAVSLAAIMREAYDQSEKAINTAAAVIALGNTTLFTIAGGPILVMQLMAICVTANDITATLLKYFADGTDGAAVDLCAASLTVASAAAGASFGISGTLATAGALAANGPAVAQVTPLIVPVGIIGINAAVGATTGTWRHYLRYKPMARGVVVS